MVVEQRKFGVEVDTKIFQIAFDCLNSKSEIVTGDTKFCEDCQEVLN